MRSNPMLASTRCSESDRELALLYVLRDPACDLEIVEARLMDDVEFAECIAETAALCEMLQATDLRSCVGGVPSSSQVELHREWAPGTMRRGRASWKWGVWLLGSATVALVILSFSLARVWNGRPSEIHDESMLSVASVWTTFQVDAESASGEGKVFSIDRSNSLASDDLLSSEWDSEVEGADSLPDWLVTATLASSQNRNVQEVN